MKAQPKKRIQEVINLYKKRLIYLAVLLLMILLFYIFRDNRAVMNFMTDHVAYPIRSSLATLFSFTGWSVAEWVVICAMICAVLFIVFLVVSLIRRRRQVLFVLFRYLTFGAAVVLTVIMLMDLTWNVNYYADGFQQKSGVMARDVSVSELYDTTKLFAERLADSSIKVARDKNGLYAGDTGAVFSTSSMVFRGVEAKFPFLKGTELRSKEVLFSRVMSRLKITGVAFPFTGEANVNIHQPDAWIPATIAHEIAHQRKIAPEQDANFVAILACDLSGNAAYRYSGDLLAFGYLGDALSGVDRAGYLEIEQSLPADVRADLQFHYDYWQQFNGKAAEMSDSVNDRFLKSNGQRLGTRSYGAVVDLLVAYYLK